MPVMTFRDAIADALRLEMRRDPDIVLIGEDIVGGRGGTGDALEAAGGPFGVTTGFAAEFGLGRVIDTPITESAIVGAANGAALTGLRPVAEVMFVDFIGCCFDQILNQMAKFRYMFGGRARTPLVLRVLIGAGYGTGPQHSQSLYGMLTSIPGIKVVIPSNPYDAKGLLIEAIRDDDPVIFCEHKMLYSGDSCEVPAEAYTIPFGEAAVRRRGKQVTIVALARMVHVANQAAERLAREGISCEIIDPRTTSPLDEDSILESVEKTGRLVVVDEDNPRCGMASEIASLAVGKAFDCLKAPVQKVTPPHTPTPSTPELEKEYIPDAARVEAAVRRVLAAGVPIAKAG
ncbi:MAG: alpha-ketoacid dehydrogenase subunit beta [Steroidobacteraceae bacterium]